MSNRFGPRFAGISAVPFGSSRLRCLGSFRALLEASAHGRNLLGIPLPGQCLGTFHGLLGCPRVGDHAFQFAEFDIQPTNEPLVATQFESASQRAVNSKSPRFIIT